jgi:fermentation-respiration switch protein FrsA (DUF1100 family)
MKKIFLLLALIPCLLFGQDFSGNWLGTLQVPGTSLRVIFKISKAADGAFSGKMDSPDQGAKDIPMDKVTITDKKITITSAAIRGQYDGELQADHNTITGTWAQGGMTFPLELKRIQELPEVKRPQNPQKPYPYLEEEVTFENKQAGFALAGTLTLPKTGGPFTAIILISGSGAQDRDETIFNHKPFLVIADYLTRQGYAVLRYDDRGTAKSKGNRATATTQDFAQDTEAAIDYLKTRQDIDSHKIGLLGHSEGGLVAPMLAEQMKAAFIILLAGPGVTGEEILLEQIAAISRLAGEKEGTIKENLAVQKNIFTILKSETDNSKATTIIRQTLQAVREKKSAEEQKAMSDQIIDMQIKQLISPWYRYFLTYDPRPALKKVKCPVLALNGEKDAQVPPKQNLPEIEKALKAGGNSHYIVKELPGLNHLFQTCKTGAVSEYAQIEETVSPTALAMISDWLKQQVK